ncbi:MAG: 2-phospho-L-lactate transferase [Gaiellaceae bacterium]
MSIPPRPYAVLCGGLGGSRFVDALARAASPQQVTAIVNVGDDVEILGLHVSPDLDAILYTLAGLLDEERGWGVRDETTNALELAGRLGGETWFTLGDRDIGLHLVRSRLLSQGVPLSEATRRLAESLEVGVHLLPASDDSVRTLLTTPVGELDFQTWFVARRHADEVTAVRYEGAEQARPAPEVLEAIAGAEVVFLAPSNPFVSIRPILAVPGISGALAGKRVVAVSPLVRGRALRGPLVEMMASLGHEPGVRGLAALYDGIATDIVVDPADAEELSEALVAPIVMVAPESRAEVGRAVLEAIT